MGSAGPRVFCTNRVRYRFTDLFRPETGKNWWNSNFKTNPPVQVVVTGVPACLTGIPDQFGGKPRKKEKKLT
jgi:hypothetical protein